MDDNEYLLEATGERSPGDPRPRRSVMRAAGGGLIAILVAVGLAACGGDVTEDELEGDE